MIVVYSDLTFQPTGSQRVANTQLNNDTQKELVPEFYKIIYYINRRVTRHTLKSSLFRVKHLGSSRLKGYFGLDF